MTRLLRLTTAAVAAAGLALGASACSAPAEKTAAAGTSAATAKTAQDLGGLDALAAAAKKEGTLNVIALPPDWANYGEMIKAFQDKYGIKVVSAQPDASSQDEINAAQQLKGQSTAPDVFDLGQAVANANTALFAPYEVAGWKDVPDSLKEAGGLWTNDYGGYMSIGYDSSKVPAPSTVQDLLKPAYKGKVALNGDPTQAGAAFSGVVMASVGDGGSADDVSKGVDFFGRLKKAGNFLPLDPTPATIASGQTPVVIDWDYLNVAQSAKNPNWKVVVPQGAVVGSYYVQAISKDAPHPAAARLWEEFVYSDQGQNIWLKGGARPVRADAMEKAGTIDGQAFGALPKVDGTPVFLSQTQTDAAKAALATSWPKVMG